MRKGVVIALAFIFLLASAASAQESRSEMSAQNTGFFTKASSGQGVSRTATNTGGLMVGYRYHINRWLSAEGNYGFDRDTQKYFSDSAESTVKSDVHSVTADFVVNLPLRVSKFSPYVLGGGGGMIFHPTGNSNAFGAGTQAKGAFLYGAGTDYVLTRHFSLRGEYRGFVYEDPDFGVRSVSTPRRTRHNRQPASFTTSSPRLGSRVILLSLKNPGCPILDFPFGLDIDALGPEA